MTAPLKRVAMRTPGASLLSAKAEDWHYGPGFDGARAIAQFGAFADLVTSLRHRSALDRGFGRRPRRRNVHP